MSTRYPHATVPLTGRRLSTPKPPAITLACVFALAWVLLLGRPAGAFQGELPGDTVPGAQPEAAAPEASNGGIGLIGHWKFDAGSGPTAVDSSGNGNQGALYGNAGWTGPGSPTGWANPVALRLDGAGDYVEVPASNILNPASELHHDGLDASRGCGPNTESGGAECPRAGPGYLLGVFKGQLDPEIWDSTGTHYRFQAGSIPANDWTHLAVTWKSGGKMIGYINGKSVWAIAASANPIGDVHSGPADGRCAVGYRVPSA